MSELESIAKLRGLPFHGTNGSGNCVTASKETINSIADEIEHEVAERFMELPVDADGVPIRVGDRLHGVYETFEVCAVSKHYAYWEYGRHWDKASECRHVEPRTLEDVLDEYYDKRGWDECDNCALDAEKLTTEFADEIRAMFGEVGE